MHRLFSAALICSLLLVIWSCTGEAPPAGDQSQTDTPAAAQEATGEVFDDGFEEGDTEEWDQNPEAGQQQENVQPDTAQSPSAAPPPSQ